jgi:hypothetical protein
MYGGEGAGADEPDAKKQRLDQEEHRVRRDTFVESMLFSVANTLAGDAEYGYNTANRIRRRVEAITEQIDDQSEDALKSSARAVLESRFALGFDDGQYLSQAVSLLWAGDGGERLRIAPLNSMPEIMRIASAKGMVQAMGGVVKRRKKDALASIKRAMRLAAWLMQLEIVRVAVLDVLKHGFENGSAGRKLFNEVHDIVSEAFATGGSLAEGSSAVLGLMDHSKGMHYTRAIIMAFCVIMQPSSTPNAIFKQLLAAMNDTVLRTERDMAKLFRVAAAMDGTFGRVMRDSDTQRGIDYADASAVAATNPGKRDNVCDNRNEYDDQLASVQQPHFDEFCTAVNEAVSRISGNHKSLPTNHSNVITTESHFGLSTAAAAAASGGPGLSGNKGWVLQSIASPMWDTINHEDWQTVLGVGTHDQLAAATPPPGTGGTAARPTPDPSAPPVVQTRFTNEEASRSMYREVRMANQNRRSYGGKLGAFASDLLDGKLNQDEAFVQYAMTRGLCGHRGIHQASNGAANEVVAYDYPTDDLKEYKKGEFVEQPEAKLSDSVLKQVYSLEEELYNTDRMQLDTDFYGNATKEQAVKSVALDGNILPVEEARKARWLPTNASNPGEPFAFDTYSQLVCEASVYEFMALSLSDPSEETDEMCKRSMRGAAAMAKLRQLECMAFVKSNRPDEEMLYGPEKMGSDVYVTRPCVNCRRANQEFSHSDVGMPVDAGVARIRPIGSTPDPVKIDAPPPNASDADNFRDPFYMSYTMEHEMPNNSLSVILANGMEVGWEPIGTQADMATQTLNGAESSRSFSLFMGPAADAQPMADAALGPYALDTGNYNKMLPDDLHVASIFNVFGGALEAIDRIEQIECEEKYVERFKVDGSEEQQRVFGLQRSVEDATRDRRADLWTDALREVAISGDRLYRFVTELTGAIGESADAAISWEDEDLKALAKEASTKQKAMADRVSRFQTKLVESVVSSTLRASKLQLDVRDRGDAANELVVVNTEVKEGIRQITSGEAGHGFFEASVELGNLLGTVSKPITIKDLVKRLQYVSMEFQDQLQNSMSVSAPMSYSRVSEPRNSFMMHLKPDTVAAIHKAFDLITSEMRACPGFHRHVYLWEYVEGKDWVLSSRFAELTGLMLQNTRMRSGSFAAYVGTAQIITNTQNVRMQIQRLKSQVCSYIMSQDTPQFLSPSGRTLYFGGTMQSISTPGQIATSSRVKKSTLGKEGGFYDEFWGSTPSPEQQGPRESLMRRIKDLVAKIENGKVSPNIVAASSGYGLDLVSQPMMQRRYFGGATQGQVMSSSTRVIQQMLGNDPATWRGVMQAALQIQQHNSAMQPPAFRAAQVQPAADWCSNRFDAADAYGWAVEICGQFERQGLEKNKKDVTATFFADVKQQKVPAHNPSKPEQKYYVVKFDFTEGMLSRFGAPTRVRWTDGKSKSIKNRTNHILKVLFQNQKSNSTRNWVHHQQWLGIGETSAVANTWLLEVHPDDLEWRRVHNLAMGIGNVAGVALGVPLSVARAPFQLAGAATRQFVRRPITTTAAFIGATQMAAGFMGPGPTQQMVSEVLSESYANSGLDVHMDVMGAKFGQWAPTMAKVSRKFAVGGKAATDLLYAGAAWTGKYAGSAYDNLIIQASGQSALAAVFKADIEIEERSVQGAISNLEMIEGPPTDYKERELTSLRAFQQVILNAKPSISRLVAAGEDQTRFNDVLDFDANFHAWRSHSQTLENIERVVADVVENPSMVELANTMGETIESAKSLSEAAGEAVAAAATMSPAKLSESFGLGLDVFEERQTSAQKFVTERMSANLKRLVEEGRRNAEDPNDAASLAPLDIFQTSLLKSREEIKDLGPKQLAQKIRELYASKLEGIVANKGGAPDITQARELSFLALMSDVLTEASSRTNGMRELRRDKESEWTLPEQFAVRALLQWEPARITQFQEVLAPAMAEIVLEAKEDGRTVSEWMGQNKNKERLMDILQKCPLIAGDVELAAKASEYLTSPIYIKKDGTQQDLYGATTLPRANYVKFMSLILGTSVQRFAQTQQIDSDYWDRYKESFPQGEINKGTIPAFVVRKGAAASFDGVQWVRHLDGLVRAKSAATKERDSEKASSVSDSASGYYAWAYDSAAYASELTKSAAFSSADKIYKNGAYYWDAAFSRPPAPPTPGPSPSPSPSARPPSPPPPLQEDDEMPAATAVPSDDFEVVGSD